MTVIVTVLLREQEHEVEARIDASGPGSGVGVEWWFLNEGVQDYTSEEEDAICEACIEKWEALRFEYDGL